MMGAMVHILGIIGDGSFAARIYVKKTRWFRSAALIAVSLYSILFIGWLVFLHIVVFSHESEVCSGKYLDKDSLIEPTPGYAIR